jgi:hypothetical protein
VILKTSYTYSLYIYTILYSVYPCVVGICFVYMAFWNFPLLELDFQLNRLWMKSISGKWHFGVGLFVVMVDLSNRYHNLILYTSVSVSCE